MIGNQSRPKIFDLNISRPSQLYEKVVAVQERVTLVGFTTDPKAEERAVVWNEAGDEVVRGYKGEAETGEGGKLIRGLSGESVRILKAPGTSAQTVDDGLAAFADLRSLSFALRCGGHPSKVGRSLRRGVPLFVGGVHPQLYLPW